MNDVLHYELDEGQPASFVASEKTARLLLRCRRKPEEEQPGLLSTSKRWEDSSSERPEDHIDLVQEAIGERLCGSLARERDAVCAEQEEGTVSEHVANIAVIVRRKFADAFVRRLVHTLGVDPQHPAVSDFLDSLIEDFRTWLADSPRAPMLLGTVMKDDSIYLRLKRDNA